MNKISVQKVKIAIQNHAKIFSIKLQDEDEIF